MHQVTEKSLDAFFRSVTHTPITKKKHHSFAKMMLSLSKVYRDKVRTSEAYRKAYEKHMRLSK